MHSVFVPPRPALEELVGVARSVATPEPVAAAAKRGVFRRREAAPQPAQPALEIFPMATMQIPITGFGNVTPSDATRLIAALGAAAREWTAPRVRFTSVVEPGSSNDRTVSIRLQGDVEGLTEIGRGVPPCVERVRFFVDRRTFHPMVTIARLTDTATDDDWNRVVAAFESFHGREWVADSIVLTKMIFDGPHTESQEFERIPIGAK